MIRLFVAVPLPEIARWMLAMLGGGIPGAKWLAAENLHLTLRFIGEVAEPMVDEITGALDRVTGVPFPLALEGVGRFGERRRVRAHVNGVLRGSAGRILRVGACGQQVGRLVHQDPMRPSGGLAQLSQRHQQPVDKGADE